MIESLKQVKRHFAVPGFFEWFLLGPEKKFLIFWLWAIIFWINTYWFLKMQTGIFCNAKLWAEHLLHFCTWVYWFYSLLKNGIPVEVKKPQWCFIAMTVTSAAQNVPKIELFSKFQQHRAWNPWKDPRMVTFVAWFCFLFAENLHFFLRLWDKFLWFAKDVFKEVCMLLFSKMADTMESLRSCGQNMKFISSYIQYIWFIKDQKGLKHWQKCLPITLAHRLALKDIFISLSRFSKVWTADNGWWRPLNSDSVRLTWDFFLRVGLMLHLLQENNQ